MGPPRERDGELARQCFTSLHDIASMGPPRERDGEVEPITVVTLWLSLQWGRRANATERPCRWLQECPDLASMGPPRERDGELTRPWTLLLPRLASMGPPRERDGEFLRADPRDCP